MEEPEEKIYMQTFLSDGIGKIREFKILSSILKDFKWLPELNVQNYDSISTFLNMASLAKYDILSDIENMLKIYFLRLPKRKRRDIEGKMRDYKTPINSYSVFFELLLLNSFHSHKNIGKVVYQDFKGSDHDFRICLGDAEFNIEFTSIYENECTKIFKNAFNDVSKRILNHIPDNKYLSIYVKTDVLLNKEQKCNEKYISDTLFQNILSIMPLILVEEGFCIIMHNIGDKNTKLIERKNSFEYHKEMGERLNKLTETEDGMKFLSETSCYFTDNSVKSFKYSTRYNKLVEIHSECLFPSKAEEYRETCLLGQLERSIKFKLKKGQLNNQVNPIIAIKFEDFRFNSYPGLELFNRGNFEKIKNTILKAFSNYKDSNVLGVLLYEDYIEKARFISNPHKTIDDTLYKKINLINYRSVGNQI